jgi:uncharacterized protein YigE (DUF2233 family)
MDFRFLAILFFIFFISPVYAAWIQIDDGLFYQKIALDNDKAPGFLHALKIDTKKNHLRPIFNKKRATVRDMAKTSGALAVINASFFDTDGKTLGLVVIDQKQILGKKDISWWSIFCVNDGHAKIFHSSQFHSGQCDNAIESGPRLVIDGVIPKLKEEYSRKSAVGIRRNGDVIFVASDKPLAISRLAQILKMPEDQGGLDCRNALNLDGGSSSQLYVKTKKMGFHIAGFSRVPVGLGVFE